MKTTAFNRSGRKVPVSVPSINQGEVDFYVEKFLMKMNGSTREIARAWVDGINYGSEMTEAIWSAIMEHPYTEIDDSITVK
jgi:hypothetical protein